MAGQAQGIERLSEEPREIAGMRQVALRARLRGFKRPMNTLGQGQIIGKLLMAIQAGRALGLIQKPAMIRPMRLMARHAPIFEHRLMHKRRG